MFFLDLNRYMKVKKKIDTYQNLDKKYLDEIRKSLLIETIYIEPYRIGCHRPNYERRCESEKNL